MRILLVDTTRYLPLTPFFLDPLKELARGKGYEYDFMDEGIFVKSVERSVFHKVAYRILRRRPLTYWALNRTLLDAAERFLPDLVLVVSGAYISPSTLRLIKERTGAFLVNYATDDPFNRRVNTPDMLNGIHLYDLYACTKKAIMDDIRKGGCKNVIYVPFGYKPSIHFPERSVTPEEKAFFASDVAFVGTYDQERDQYFEQLIRHLPDIRLRLYGSHWDRHPTFRHYHRGMALGRNYRLALGETKIAIHLVRRANRDGHSLRTFEIPACHSFLLGDRTEEHLQFFREDEEAVFFESPEELVEKVHYYIARDDERECIAKAGYWKVVGGRNTYADRLLQILHVVDASA